MMSTSKNVQDADADTCNTSDMAKITDERQEYEEFLKEFDDDRKLELELAKIDGKSVSLDIRELERQTFFNKDCINMNDSRSEPLQVKDQPVSAKDDYEVQAFINDLLKARTSKSEPFPADEQKWQTASMNNVLTTKESKSQTWTERGDTVNDNLQSASTEVLYDSASETSLINLTTDLTNDEIEKSHRIKYSLLTESPSSSDEEPVPPNPFPDWLLNLITSIHDEPTASEDEPHFYCQGDGIGVHPSVTALHETSSSETTSDTDSQHSTRSTSPSVRSNVLESTAVTENGGTKTTEQSGSDTLSQEYFDAVQELTGVQSTSSD